MTDADRSYDASNAAFQDYATSGAFQVSLARITVGKTEANYILRHEFRCLTLEDLVSMGLMKLVLPKPGSFTAVTDPERKDYILTDQGQAFCEEWKSNSWMLARVTIHDLTTELAVANGELWQMTQERNSLMAKLKAVEDYFETLALEKSRDVEVQP